MAQFPLLAGAPVAFVPPERLDGGSVPAQGAVRAVVLVPDAVRAAVIGLVLRPGVEQVPASLAPDRAEAMPGALQARSRVSRAAVQAPPPALVRARVRVLANGPGRARAREPVERSRALLAASRLSSQRHHGCAGLQGFAQANPRGSASRETGHLGRSSSPERHPPERRPGQRPSRSARRRPRVPQGACGKPSQTQDMNGFSNRVQSAPYGNRSAEVSRFR